MGVFVVVRIFSGGGWLVVAVFFFLSNFGGEGIGVFG